MPTSARQQTIAPRQTAGHTGPALRDYRRVSVEFVGATLCGRPWGAPQGVLSSAALSVICSANATSPRGGGKGFSNPRGAVRAHSVGKRQPLQRLLKAPCSLVGAASSRPSTYGSASIYAAGCPPRGLPLGVGIPPYKRIRTSPHPKNFFKKISPCCPFRGNKGAFCVCW